MNADVADMRRLKLGGEGEKGKGRATALPHRPPQQRLASHI